MWKSTLGLRSYFLRGFGRKCYIPWEAGCVENIINTIVVIRFTVLEKLLFQVSFLWLCVSFWELFEDPGTLLVIFEGAGKRSEKIMTLGTSPGRPQAEGTRSGEG